MYIFVTFQCLTTGELLQLFQYEKLDRLNADHFWHLCPALIDQLDAGFCKKDPPAVESKDLNSGGVTDHEHAHDGSEYDHHHDHDHTDSHSHEDDHGNTNKTETQESADTHPVTATGTIFFFNN